MKNIVALIIHNRFENLKRWIHCWEQSTKGGAELIVIHNYIDGDSLTYGQYCAEHNIKYIPRNNVGFDIGAFQDVCRERLAAFPNDWDKLLWITDDVIPMRKDFAEVFFNALEEVGVGLSCMHISREGTKHVRTTGFCIRKDIAKKLTFIADPVTTKVQCYDFEHRGGIRTLYNQVLRMGYKVVQLGDLKISPLWDIGHSAFLRLNRMEEHNSIFADNYKLFPEGDKVTFICPIYNNYPQIISSLICQTHKNWELLLIHDGPNNTGLQELVKSFGDNRIKYTETSVRTGNWGHKIRRDTLQSLKNADTNYVVITNPDNYHVPVYTEYMLRGFKRIPHAIATYCSKMVHSYRAWDSQDCRLERGWLDCGGVMVKKETACDVGWNNILDHSADWLYFNDIIRKYGSNKFVKIPGCLFIHN